MLSRRTAQPPPGRGAVDFFIGGREKSLLERRESNHRSRRLQNRLHLPLTWAMPSLSKGNLWERGTGASDSRPKGGFYILIYLKTGEASRLGGGNYQPSPAHLGEKKNPAATRWIYRQRENIEPHSFSEESHKEGKVPDFLIMD